MDNQIIKSLEGITKNFSKNKNQFYPYIDYIRFPHYKSLSLNSRINFNFPITLLVGRNGVNKLQFYKLYMVLQPIKVCLNIGLVQMLIK